MDAIHTSCITILKQFNDAMHNMSRVFETSIVWKDGCTYVQIIDKADISLMDCTYEIRNARDLLFFSHMVASLRICIVDFLTPI